jgi:hypothetical protein
VARPPSAQPPKASADEAPETPVAPVVAKEVVAAGAEIIAPPPPAPKPAPPPPAPSVAREQGEPDSFEVAPETSAAPAAAAGLEEIWQRLREGVRQRRPFISTWLDAGMLLSMEGKTAVIGFPTAQAIPAEYCQQTANRKLLETILGEVTGRTISLRCETREGLEVTPPPPPEPEVPRDPMEEFKNDPLIKRALEIFRAEIQPA